MSKITVIQCPSGFWAVMVDGQVWTAASPTKEHAENIVKDLERRTGR